MKALVIDEGFLSELERLQTLVKNNLSGMFGGNRQTKNFGSSCEFASHRDYIAGDDVTKIDWNAYARFDKLYQKQFFDERQMHTKIYIDASRSMSHEKDEQKASQAIKLAATFAYLSLCEMDRVSIYTIRNSELDEIVSSVVGKDAFLTCVQALNAIEFDYDAKISEAIAPSSVGNGNGLSILISDFLTDDDYERAIDKFANARRDLLCIQILSREEINPQIRGKMHLFDAENNSKFFRKKIDADVIRAYKDALNYVKDRIRSYCEARECKYVFVPSFTPISEIFFEKLYDLEVVK